MRNWTTTTLLIALFVQFGSLMGYSPKGAASIQTSIPNGETFDFIVGGGTAGCAVAARLAETGDHSVLLIESGGFPHPNLSVPALTPGMYKNPNILKVFRAVKQEGAAIAQNGSIAILRGNMLGGTSGLNAQVLNRGSPQDYNNWAKLTGDDSWNYANMLKYFRKFEDYSGEHPSDQRGTDGPITVSRQRYAPGMDVWLEAGRELGYEVGEPNAPQKINTFTPLEYIRMKGRRVSSYHGYIEPLLRKGAGHSSGKSNLIILTHTEVNRIIFEGNRAVGVNFTANNATDKKGYAHAKKEIILSLGTIDSPALLMKSGIGPNSVLTDANIPIVKNLPVGKNLHFHPLAAVVVAFSNRSAAFDEDKELTPEAWNAYQKSGDGPYSSFAGTTAHASLGSSVLPPEEKQLGWADLQLIPTFSNVRGGSWDRDQVQDLREGEIAVPWPIFMTRPKSRGSVTLNPKDIDGPPVIDFQYLANPYDLQVLVDGFKKYVHICENTTAFRNVGCRVIEDRLSDCGQHKYRSDSYWECYGRQKTRSSMPTMGTCRMGRGPNDAEAVVDSKLRVIGIEGLRVADASIMPTTNANPMAPVYAIGEKAADMILEKWRRA